jgi:hypothetical protein
MTRVVRALPLGLLCGAVFALGCGYPPLDSSNHPDAGSGTGTGTDGGPTCEVAPSFATSNVNTQTAGFSNHDNAMYYEGHLDTAAAPTVLDIELFIGGTYFPQQINGNETVPLANETQGKTCDGCVLVFTQCTGCDIQQDGTFSEEYIASAGTLQLTAPSNTTISGTLSNVKFTHVTEASDGTTTPVGDGCTTMIGSLSFTATVQNLP